MQKSRLIPPYTKGTTAKSNIKFAADKSGVYMIFRSGNDNPVYVGYSAGQLEKTILRHFQQWDDKRQSRVTYGDRDDMRVRVILTTPGRAAKLERALIIKYRPKDNPDKLKQYSNPTPGEMSAYQEYEYTPVSKIDDLPF